MKYLLIAMILWAGVAQAQEPENLICLSEKDLSATVTEAIWVIEYLRDGLPDQNFFCKECGCIPNKVKKYECLADLERQREAADERVKKLLKQLKE